MRRSGRNFLLLALACVAGIGTAELTYRSTFCRAASARLMGRGRLVALVNHVGIYEQDRNGLDDGNLESLVVAENLRRISRREQVSESDIGRELDLLRFQFADEKAFATAMESAGLSTDALHEQIAEHLRGRAWIEGQIASALRVTDNECRLYYETRQELFAQPQRLRANHLFLAAHEATPRETVDAKAKAIQGFTERIKKGETVAQLAAAFSEDEATKKIGGDLGFFSAERTPSEFYAAVQNLRVGESSAPFQSHLGFHIVELTEIRPPRRLSFDEARPEIANVLANGNRTSAVAALSSQLGVADFLQRGP